MAATPLPHDLTPLGAKGWVASNLYYRSRDGAWTYMFAFGENGLLLEVEDATRDGALLGMLDRIATVEKLMHPRRGRRRS